MHLVQFGYEQTLPPKSVCAEDRMQLHLGMYETCRLQSTGPQRTLAEGVQPIGAELITDLGHPYAVLVVRTKERNLEKEVQI